MIAWPALWHPERTSALFAPLSSPDAASALVAILVPIGAVLAVAAVTLTVRSLVRTGGTVARRDIELALLVALAFALDPLLFFALYFCTLHAPRHVRHALARHGQVIERSLVPIAVCTALALAAITAGLAWLPIPEPTDRIVAATSIGLLALTMPHALLERAVGTRRGDRVRFSTDVSDVCRTTRSGLQWYWFAASHSGVWTVRSPGEQALLECNDDPCSGVGIVACNGGNAVDVSFGND